MTTVGRTSAELRRALAETRHAWSARAWLGTAVFAAALLVPIVLSSHVAVDRLAHYAYLAAAAVALGLVVGPGGMPSLCQGVFVGLGAVISARLGAVPLLVSLACATAVAALAGAAVGAGFARLRAVYLAVATWLIAWGFALALLASPRFVGGTDGLVVGPGHIGSVDLTPTVHYELGVVLVFVVVLGVGAVRRSALGLQLEGVAVTPAGAAALGVPRGAARTKAFAVSAAVAGLAGALAVHLALVADPAAYGPYLSFQLLVACLVGGAASPVGPVVGIALVGLMGPVGEALGRLTGAETARFGAMLSALLLVAVLASGTGGIVPALEARLRARRRPAPEARAEPVRVRTGERLEARGLVKRFDDHVALAGLDLDLEPGRITALIGPNGSGKSTALRLLSGSLVADEGRVHLADRVLDGHSARDRARLGIVRTLQRPPAFAGMFALDAVTVGAAADLPPRAVRAFFATPTARAGGRSARADAHSALDAVGIREAAERRCDELTGAERQLVAIAAALATGPSVLLLDEPAAGAGAQEVARLGDVLRRLRADGLTLLVVEHNLRLVHDVADVVVVLDRGAILARGTPADVAGDPRVRAAYLGSGDPNGETSL
ncbi:MAG TPA: ATP-binding cassette domain-containing protein [Gaiella sp.]